MEILWFKIVSVMIIFGFGLVGGMVPTRFSMNEAGRRNLVLGNAFAGGIFLGAGLLHMLPDARENFGTYYPNSDFPLFALICGIGFLLILLIEKALLRGSEDVGAMSENRAFYPFMLCLILSVHSIIAGTSLGLEASLLSSIAILIAIVAHKGSAAFALGVSLKNSAFPAPRHMVLIIFFSVMTPLGVLLGSLFATAMSDKTAILMEAIFDGLAAGTFLYVAVADIMKEVFEQVSDRWLKILFIITGFLLMALIAIWA
jgi:zinc transporter 1/2/3